MNSLFLIIASCALMGAAALCLLFFTSEGEGLSIEDGSLLSRRDKMAASSFLWRTLVHLSGVLSPLHSRRALQGYLTLLQAGLSSAGSPGALRAEEFLVVKELLAAIVGALAFLLGFKSPSAILLSLSIGFFYPDLWLREKVKGRGQEILRSLPLTLDLLTLCVEAGLDLITSLGRLVEKIPRGPLREELFQMLQEIRMGRGRSEALKELARRVDIPEVSMLTSTIIQAGDMGIGVAQALRIYSTDLRSKRFRQAEKRAMEAPVKMSFPLLFIFASVFVLLFGALALDVMRGGVF